MPCIEITDEDFDDMHHALGRPADPMARDNYRNYYALDADSETARRFQANGCWDHIGTGGVKGGAVYRVNDDGRSALADWLKLRRLAAQEGPGKGEQA